MQVTVARLDAVTKRVTGVASSTTTAGGRYTIRTGLPIGQAGYYALTAVKSGLDAGRSRLYGLIVPRPATPGRAAGRVSTASDPACRAASPADRDAYANYTAPASDARCASHAALGDGRWGVGDEFVMLKRGCPSSVELGWRSGVNLTRRLRSVSGVWAVVSCERGGAGRCRAVTRSGICL